MGRLPDWVGVEGAPRPLTRGCEGDWLARPSAIPLILWSHPYSAYGQKASVALYELGLPFESRLIDAADEAVMTEFRTRRSAT